MIVEPISVFLLEIDGKISREQLIRKTIVELIVLSVFSL